MSFVLIIFLIIGAVNATDLSNVSITEDSNLVDKDYPLSNQDKLEISSEDSISETNIVNSHDDNLNGYPVDDSLGVSEDSNYEDNSGIMQASVTDDDENSVISASSSDDDVIAAVDSNDDVIALSADSDILSASPKSSTTMSISDTHYAKSATYFKVTLKDGSGAAVSGEKVSLKVNGKTYTGSTNSNGVASIKTASLAIGTYTVSLTYSGSSKYSASSLSKKVKVLSSVKGTDLTKYDGYIDYYKATFWKNDGVLANTKVSFTINGVTYTKTTDKNGVALLEVNLKHGKYVVTAVNPYSKEKLSGNVIIKKDSTILTHGSKKTYIAPKTKYTFTVTLKTKHGALISGEKIKFTYNNKQVTAKTNSKGKATITIPVLSKGTYKITYKFAGNSRFPGSSETGYLYVKNPTTKLTSSALKMTYKDGSKFTVKLTKNGKILANKNVKFKLNGKTSTVKTDSNGKAKLDIGNLKPGTYKVTYSYSSRGSSDYYFGSNKVVISKISLKLSAGNLKMKYRDGSYYSVVVKNSAGKVLKNVKVDIIIKGKTYARTTDSNGVAKQLIGLIVGTYKVKSVVSTSCYKSNAVSKKIVVEGTKFVADEKYVTKGSSVSYSVKLLNSKNSPIKNKKVTFTCNGKTYTKTSNSKGIAKVSLGTLSVGNHKIKFSDGSYSGTSKIHVVDKVTIKQIISSSKTVKSYIVKHKKLPTSVKVGKLTLSTADYMYLASKAIVKLKSGDKSSIAVKHIKEPSKPGSAKDKGNLNNYLAVAKSIVKTADSKGKMPNSVSSNIGTIGYKGLVYAFARVNAFYGSHNRMPSYVSIDSLSTSSSSSSGSLNSKNTIEDLTAYLAASKNCQVDNPKIKELVAKLTKGLTSQKAKAKAIFNYVRDTVSYSFYYDTKYGAVGTLNAKAGNCVDHSHLLVAMYRTAGLAARYAHGSCTFSSGSTYGHVWSQVLIGDTWTVSDATSSRNSLGSVANWNTNSYKLYSYSSSLSF